MPLEEVANLAVMREDVVKVKSVIDKRPGIGGFRAKMESDGGNRITLAIRG